MPPTKDATVWRRTVAANRGPGALTDQESLKIIVRPHGASTAIELHGESELAGLPSIRRAISKVMEGAPDSGSRS